MEREIIEEENETKIKLLAFIHLFFFMNISVNVTNTFFHDIAQNLSYLNKLDYHSDYTSIKLQALRKKGAPTEHFNLNSKVA